MTFLDFVVRHEAHQGSIPTIGFLPMAELTRHLNEVLRLSQEFFDPIDLAQGAAAPYCFFHTRFPEFIAAQLSEVERKDCHCLLAQGCSGFKQFKRSIRYYALRHRLAHLIAGQDWEGVASIFAESDFIVERSERFGFASVHADALTTAQHPNLPHDWREAFSEWERFLRLRMWGLQLFPAAYPQEVFNEFLPTAPKPLDDALTPLRDSFPFAYNLSLRKTFGPTARIGSKHKDMMECVAFSPDGSFMASGSRDGTVKVWESATSKLAADCHGHTGGVESIAFSSDGRFVASGSADTTVKVWQAETGRLTADCRGHTDKVNSIAFSPDRRFVASGSSDWTMKIWESETGWLVADCVGHEYDVCSVVFSFDGRFVASGSYDGTVVVWEAETGLVVGDCIGHTRIVRSVAFSPDGRFVASGSSDMTVKVWEAKTGRLVATCVGHQDIVSSVVFSPDGRFVASGSHDGTVKVWKAETGRLVMDGVGHEHWVYSVAFSPEGGFVVSLSNDQTVKIWELKTGGCVNTLLFDHDVLKVAFLANQPRLMVADCAGQVFGYEVIAL
jgi:WD40 repeat protein